MEEQKKVMLTGSLVILFVALVVVVYYFFIREKAKEALPIQDVVEEKAVPVQSEESVDEEAVESLQVELDQSDGVLRELAGELSSHQELGAWLKSKNLIRKFVAAVDNIANGLSPRPQIDFFTPRGEFKIKRKSGRYYVDPTGYTRYNLVGNVFSSLDATQTVELYRRAKPLIQEAYAELGYPNEDFDGALIEAIVEMLKVPVVQGDMPLERKVISYGIADPGLENLSEAQKYLLRMGPENTRKIQGKLRELSAALDIPGSLLPRAKVYIPVNRIP